MKQESFSHYRLIDEKTHGVVYLYSINDDVADHEYRLEKKKVEMMYSKDISYQQLFWEKNPCL